MSTNLPPLPPLPPPQPPAPFQPAPFQPAPLGYATPMLDTGRKDLRAIAMRQKAIQYCILADFVMILGQFFLPAELKMLALMGLLIAGLTACVYAITLSIAVYGTGGIALGILVLIPYLGILFLLIINGKATSILRAHNIQVGLMGAKMSQIPPPSA